MTADRNLLFAVLALQADFLSRDQFVEACTLWANRKETPLAELLVEKGWLSTADCAVVQALLDRKVKRHAGDATVTLGAVADDPVRRLLAAIVDPAFAATLSQLPGAAGGMVYLSTLETPPPAVGRFALTRIHAEGGIGRIWLARDPALGREVAVKELRPDRATNEAARERFVREARVTGQLEHPGIIPVYELSSRPDDGQPFYAMRLVRGRTLAEAIREYHAQRAAGTAGALALRGLLDAFVAVCNAVAYAHNRGVLHRDLKPQNVVLGEFGVVMLLDWGLAKLLHADDDDPARTADVLPPITGSGSDLAATEQGTVLGTPAYMAPEQASGNTAAIGIPTDVFGLGAILYELLTGRPPFTGQSTAEVLTRARAADAPAPRTVAPDVPRALDAICRKAIAKAPAERYQAVSELVDEVRHYLADEPVTAYREPVRVRAGRWARRHKTLVAGSAAALVVLLGSATGFAVWRDEKRHEKLALIYEKQNYAMAAAQSGDVDRAITHFREYEAVAEASDEPHFRDFARDHRVALEKFRDFRTKAAAALKEGVHNIRSAKKPDPVLVTCEEALAISGFLDPDSEQSRVAIGFGAREHDETLATSRELLVLAAVRLAMFDTKDEAAKVNTRRALAYLDRAAALKLYGPGGQIVTGPTAGELMLRMFWHRRLGENKEADEAGDKMSALVKADGGFRTARDYYIFGSITLNIVKKPKDALNAYREALKREPNHYGALFGLYLCHSELKDFPGQVAALTGCLAVRPAEADLYLFRGAAFFSQQQYDAAYHDFDSTVLLAPDRALGYYWRGRSRVMGDKWAEAEADFGRAVDRDATLVNARSWRAITRGKVGQAEGAAADAEAAVAAHPTSADTLFYAARAYALAAKAPATAETYGARCVGLLRQALDRGFTVTTHLSPGSDFDPVRDRADFQELLKRITGKKPAKEQAPAPRAAK